MVRPLIGREVFKFGMFVSMPIAAMYYYSLPSVQDDLFTKHKVFDRFTPKENERAPLMKTAEDLDRFREAMLAKKRAS